VVAGIVADADDLWPHDPVVGWMPATTASLTCGTVSKASAMCGARVCLGLTM
jgi:hypothetical protein